MPHLRAFEVAVRDRKWRYEQGKKVYAPDPDLGDIVATVKALLESTHSLKPVHVHAHGRKLAVTLRPSDIWYATIEQDVANTVGFHVAHSDDFEIMRN